MFMMFLLELAFCIQQKPYILYNTLAFFAKTLTAPRVHTLIFLFCRSLFRKCQEIAFISFQFLAMDS